MVRPTPPTVVISLDLELCWGTFDLHYNESLLEMGRWTHDVGAPRLLHHLTRNGLPATWAIVGAMMGRRLPEVSELPEVHFSHFPRPWFGCIPRHGDETTHPEWFGAQLVEMIRKAKPEQEIGFHSFSHVPFGSQGMTRERAVAEYRYCARVARELGLHTTSFVFPRNSVAFLRELREAGFVCFRDTDLLPVRFASEKLTSLYMIWADFIGQSPQLVEPALKDGLVAIPGSLLIRYAAGWRKYIPDTSRLRRLRKGLELVRRNGGVFHVWFHPENLYAGWPRLENVVARFFEELGVFVRNREVRCLTMGQLALEFLLKLAAKQKTCSARDGASEVAGPIAAAHSLARSDHESSWSNLQQSAK